MFAVVLIAAIIHLRSWLNGYLESDAFRKKLGEMTSKHLKARCEYAPFHFSWMSISTDSFKAQGAAQAAFSNLEVEKFHTALNLNALWDRRLEIDEVSVGRLFVSLGHTGAEPVPESEIGVEPEKEEKTPSKPGVASSYAPKLDLRKVIVKDTNLLWGEKTAQDGSIKNTVLTITPAVDAWNVILAGGMISQKGSPDLKLDHLNLHCRAPLITITDGLLIFPPGGNIGLRWRGEPGEKYGCRGKGHGHPHHAASVPRLAVEIEGQYFRRLESSRGDAIGAGGRGSFGLRQTRGCECQGGFRLGFSIETCPHTSPGRDPAAPRIC